jgi:cytolysin-activating lysine-acyltransferase
MSSTTPSDTVAVEKSLNVAETIGQIVWLLGQSPLHSELKLKDLAWSIMPAVVSGQFRIFRFGPTPALGASPPEDFQRLGMSREEFEQLPLGLALWAQVSEAVEIKLEAGDRLTSADWATGDRLWLVELISPFATAENKLLEVMMADLIEGPFNGRSVALHRTDPKTGARVKVLLGG